MRLADLDRPDPPVVFRLDSFRPEERVWQPFLDRVSLACVEMVLSEWMLSSGDWADNRELDPCAVEALEARFARLPMPDYPLWAEPDGPPVRWFGSEGVVLRDDASAWVWVHAVSAQRLADVRHAMPGDWLMVEG